MRHVQSCERAYKDRTCLLLYTLQFMYAANNKVSFIGAGHLLVDRTIAIAAQRQHLDIRIIIAARRKYVVPMNGIR